MLKNFYSKKTFYLLLGLMLLITLLSLVSLELLEGVLALLIIGLVAIAYSFYLKSLFYHLKFSVTLFHKEIISSLHKNGLIILKVQFPKFNERIPGEYSITWGPIIKFGGYIQNSNEYYRKVLIEEPDSGKESWRFVKITTEFKEIKSIELVTV